MIPVSITDRKPFPYPCGRWKHIPQIVSGMEPLFPLLEEGALLPPELRTPAHGVASAAPGHNDPAPNDSPAGSSHSHHTIHVLTQYYVPADARRASEVGPFESAVCSPTHASKRPDQG